MVTRGEFVRGIIRILMVSVLAFIAVSLGSRAVTGEQDCSGCPGKGVCGGEEDCKKFSRSRK